MQKDLRKLAVVVVVVVLRPAREYFAHMEMSALLVKLRAAKFRPLSTSLSCHTWPHDH